MSPLPRGSKDQDRKQQQQKDRLITAVLLEQAAALKDVEAGGGHSIAEGPDMKLAGLYHHHHHHQQATQVLEEQLSLLSKISRHGIPYRQPRRSHGCSVLEQTCGSLPPWMLRNRVMCQMLAGVILVLVLVQALSCGLFFCVSVPLASSQYMDLRDLFTEFSLVRPSITSSGAAGSSHGDSLPPMLIPRIVHQTFQSKAVPERVQAFMESWAEQNPNWQLRFYDDAACVEFVRREFPEYLDAYLALPKDVERSDFFRYMVVLRTGGVYADIDVECRQPLDSVLQPTDTMVVGWESEVATDALAFKRHFVRRRQVLQWFFAAAPGHPVLRAICDHVARNVHTVFSNNTNRDTLERTGPGAWTDAVLRHALSHPAAQAPGGPQDPWGVRILPRVAFGVHPAGIDGLTPDDPSIVVLHHFLGSWKKKGGWHSRRTLLQLLGELWGRLRRSQDLPPPEEPIKDLGTELFPVSLPFSPAPFVVMVPLVGHGDLQAGADVSASITSFGTWQAALSPRRKPSVLDALVGSLGSPSRPATLLDVSAGQGLFALAAAARGHRSIALEMSAPSLRALRASVAYNGFEQRVSVQEVVLGARDGELACLERADPASPGAGGQQQEQQQVQRPSLSDLDRADVNMRRGYGDPAAHAASGAACAHAVRRVTLATLLGLGAGGNVSSSSSAAGSSSNAPVGALRLSANGWEGWILEGVIPALRIQDPHTRPGVILLELSPARMRRAGYQQPEQLFAALFGLGYTHAAHAGYVCDERWINATRAAAKSGGSAAAAWRHAHLPTGATASDTGGASYGRVQGQQLGQVQQQQAGVHDDAELQQPTWCKLKSEHVPVLLDRAHEEVPENVLFIHETHHSIAARDGSSTGIPPAATAGQRASNAAGSTDNSGGRTDGTATA